MIDPNSPEQLEANVRGRKAGLDMVAFLSSGEMDLDDLARPRYWETLAEYVLQKCGYSTEAKAPVANAPFSYDEALAFERTVVPFGKHQGERAGDVPVGYWTFITEGEFNRQLIRYLKSDHYRQRQERES